MKDLIMSDDSNYPKKIYASQLVTTDDLKELRKFIVNDILLALKNNLPTQNKKWLKSHEVRRMLKISPGTLQTLKNKGTIPYTKIGGVHFYDYEQIVKLLDSKA